MNEPQLDQALRAWLDEGADKAPERFVWAAIDDIESVGQRRLRWLLPEGINMSIPKPAAYLGAAAAVVVVIAVAIAFTRPNIGGLGLDEPASAAPTVTVTETDCTLDGFTGPIQEGDLSIAAVNATDGQAAFDMFRIGSDGSFAAFEEVVAEERRLAEAGEPYIGPPVWADYQTGSGEIEPAGSVTISTRLLPGTYAIVCLSAYAVTEDPYRAFALVGPIEVEEQRCQASDPACTGLLEPGTHSTDALVTPVTYTVPDGWRKVLDVEGSFQLEPEAFPGTHVGIRPDWAIASQTDCTRDPEPGMGRTVEALVAFISEHPGLIASTPGAASVGGLEGQMVEASVDPAFEGPCPGEVNLFTHMSTIDDVGWWPVADGSRLRLYFLDAGGDRVVTIHIETVDESNFEAFLEIAQPVVDSFDFTP